MSFKRKSPYLTKI